MAPTTKAWLMSLIDVPFLYYWAGCKFFVVLWRRLKTAPSSIFPLTKLAEDSFAEMWLGWGIGDPRQGPNAASVPLFGSASGVVLDLGPGAGNQTRWLSSDKITAIYGAEPAEILHGSLKKEAEDHGLGDKYHVLGCGGQPDSLLPMLVKIGLVDNERASEVFDTVLSSKVLCTIPHQKETVAMIYSLLKPGGRVLVVEHIKNKWREPGGSVIARIEQILFTLIGYPFFAGGCKVNCDTIEVLKAEGAKHGGWASVDLQTPQPYSSLPMVIGSFTKRG